MKLFGLSCLRIRWGGEDFFCGVNFDERYIFLLEFLLISTVSNNLVDGVNNPADVGHLPSSINT